MSAPETQPISPADLLQADELLEKPASDIANAAVFIEKELSQAGIADALIERDESQKNRVAYNIHLQSATPHNVLIDLGKRIQQVLGEHDQTVSLQFYSQGHRIFIP